MRFSAVTKAPSQEELDRTVEFMKKHIDEGEPLCCNTYMLEGRSATVVAAYLIETESSGRRHGGVPSHEEVCVLL